MGFINVSKDLEDFLASYMLLTFYIINVFNMSSPCGLSPTFLK